ncbi:uncharacterized protein C8Q71DRAFT_300370 [Rhodofomes roseus]|uniref:F-box domain-containing protein n=1 Tax=Rhodofomes roseus TaxID=34475 RepID=A0ABQ8K398_9APHY|nr:uncharacterized protein C8Q71DRAFT_300370 [Rhodofomes roseus]KAH9831364.1 hypothetical protein C8Q71DRAFT_300370 [Rhodofomes roseus]
MPATSRRGKLLDEDYELNDPEDDISDWEETHRRRSGGSSQKRARGSKAGSSRVKRRASAKLCKLPTLPLDIIYEILSLLTPIDLANLAHTDTAFRSTLTSPQASSIWKAARKRNGSVPDCPPNAGEVVWARFIYSTPNCEECDASHIHYVDFALRRRVCKRCKKQKFVYAPFFGRRFPDFDPEMLELIPHSNIGCSSTKRSKAKADSKFYWEDDIYA